MQGGTAREEIETPDPHTGWQAQRLLARFDPVERLFLRFVDLPDDKEVYARWQADRDALTDANRDRLDNRILGWHAAGAPGQVEHGGTGLADNLEDENAHAALEGARQEAIAGNPDMQKKVGDLHPMPPSYRFPKICISDAVCAMAKESRLTATDLSDRLHPHMLLSEVHHLLSEVTVRAEAESDRLFYVCVDDVGAVEGMIALASIFQHASIASLVLRGASQGGVFPADAQMIAFHNDSHAFLSNIRNAAQVRHALAPLLDREVECPICLEPLVDSDSTLDAFGCASRLRCGHALHTRCWETLPKLECPLCRETRVDSKPTRCAKRGKKKSNK
jgi:hypothetical protein